MARPLRIEFPGAVYHVTSRGNERKEIFIEGQDRKMFLDTLENVTLRYNRKSFDRHAAVEWYLYRKIQ